MKKNHRTTRARAPRRPAQHPLSSRAARTFVSLAPSMQAHVLNLIALAAHVPPSRLYSTPEQRAAARASKAETKAWIAKAEAKAHERVEIRTKLNAIHNRAQQRRHGALTPAEERRREALYAQLNAIDMIGGAR